MMVRSSGQILKASNFGIKPRGRHPRPVRKISLLLESIEDSCILTNNTRTGSTNQMDGDEVKQTDNNDGIFMEYELRRKNVE